MDHFPGRQIAEKAQLAIDDGRDVVVIIQGRDQGYAVTNVSIDGPFARCEHDEDYMLVRLDALVGVKVTTKYNVDALIG